jgi:hypothetical protein
VTSLNDVIPEPTEQDPDKKMAAAAREWLSRREAEDDHERLAAALIAWIGARNL